MTDTAETPITDEQWRMHAKPPWLLKWQTADQAPPGIQAFIRRQVDAEG